MSPTRRHQGIALTVGPLVVALSTWGCLGSLTVEVRTLVAEIELSETIPTVATATWSVDPAEVVHTYVEFGPDTTYGRRTEAVVDESGRAEATILGLKPDSDVHVRVVVDDGDEEVHGPDDVFTTGPHPAHFPSCTITGESPETAHIPTGYIVTSIIPGPAVILDGDGDFVWWYEPEGESTYRVIPIAIAPDGQSVLMLVWNSIVNGGPYDEGRYLIRLAWDGEVLDRRDAFMNHHGFHDFGDGTIAILAYDVEEQAGGEEITGEQLLELHPDGTEEQIWTIWDHVPWDPEYKTLNDDWGHCNAMDYYEDEEAYYIGCRYTNHIYRIERATGEPTWAFGRDGDFELTTGDDYDWFSNQHQFDFYDDKVLVFDNSTAGEMRSRVLEYRLDHENFIAEPTWRFEPDPPMESFVYGDVARLPNDNVMIVWSTPGQIEEVSRDGEVIWRINVSLGGVFGYSRWVPSLGPN